MTPSSRTLLPDVKPVSLRIAPAKVELPDSTEPTGAFKVAPQGVCLVKHAKYGVCIRIQKSDRPEDPLTFAIRAIPDLESVCIGDTPKGGFHAKGTKKQN